MRKMTVIMILLMVAFSFAEQCFFQSRRTSYDSRTTVRKISCQTVKNSIQDVRFYNGNDNYAHYYEQKIGQEGNLIVEDNGNILMTKFYYALGEYRYYGQISYSGANVISCQTTTSSGYCDKFEYTDFGNYLREFLSSPARKKKMNR